jgi:hypothetical protein
MASYFLLENGTDRILLEDGASLLEMEEVTVVVPTVTTQAVTDIA